MTRALDTNVIVRVLADRSSPQFESAAQTLDHPFLIPVTVLVEVEWVVRSVYRWQRAEIAAAFRDLMDLPNLTAPPTGIFWVIGQYEAGADFADMMHLNLSDEASSFVTFDADLARGAGANSPLPIETLP
jgi:predicted nucleic-acid-binding protein